GPGGHGAGMGLDGRRGWPRGRTADFMAGGGECWAEGQRPAFDQQTRVPAGRCTGRDLLRGNPHTADGEREMVATDGQTRERNGQERGRTGTANQPGLSHDLKQINPDWPAGRINERSNSRVDSSPGRPVRRDAWKSGDRNRYITPRDQVLGSRRRPRDDRVERGFEPGATFREDRAGIGLDSGHAGYGLWLIDGNGAR